MVPIPKCGQKLNLHRILIWEKEVNDFERAQAIGNICEEDGDDGWQLVKMKKKRIVSKYIATINNLN